jgi:hypothetical protein
MTDTSLATRSVFVAGSFKNAIDAVTGLVNTHLRSRSIDDDLQGAGRVQRTT